VQCHINPSWRFPTTLDILFSLDSSTDIDQTTLMDVIAEQEWCISINKTNIMNKVMIMMAKLHLASACEWLDNKLPAIYTQHIADKMDVTTLLNIIPQ